jgi:serine/threonine-protein kinase HipA
MNGELVTLLGDVEIGRLRRDRRGRISFVYDHAWRQTDGTVPLSLSMPLALAQHRPAAVDAFVRGLLPDNELILKRWAARFQTSATNAFTLLARVGRDCAGAVRFLAPDEVERALGRGRTRWLDEATIAAWLRALREDVAAWHADEDEGHFTLAGAQAKTALLCERGRWGIPSPGVPTTHIVKTGIPWLASQAEHEHFCMALAKLLGMPVATSTVERFEDQVAIVVERYDRLRTEEGLVRVHQEDVCQALGLSPAKKLEKDGGPTPRDIARVLREYSRKPEEDVATLIDALAFNWLIGAPDAHAKNYSFLLGAGGRIRLAPLYDLASALPYDPSRIGKLRLAMSIGGKSRITEIGVADWTKLSGELERDAEALLGRVRGMAERLPDLATDLAKECRAQGLAPKPLRALEIAIIAWARRCGERLSGNGT